MYVNPAIVTVPVRATPVEFAAIEKFTVPLPVPLAPEVTVIQSALLTAVQAQALLFAVTFTLLVVAAEEILALYEDSVYEQIKAA